MIHLVVPIAEKLTDEDRVRLEETISINTKASFFGYAPQFYVVAFGGTAAELSKLIGFGVEPEKMRGFVASISKRACYGFARGDFWDWIEINGQD